jgi:alginate O-acetyltransferase complex protein AlgI
MLFNSFEFVVFFTLVLAVWCALGRRFAARKTLLLLASWTFYATWSPRFLPLLVATTAVDFHLARWIYARRWAEPGREHPDGIRRARPLLIASLLANLGLLGFFKYGGFLYRSAAVLIPLGPLPDVLRVVAPLGISFYTFHSISYVIDTYRGLRPPTDDFRDFALYVAFFPQLLAGPILRAGHFLPQLKRTEPVRDDEILTGVELFCLGLFKKVAVADNMAVLADQVFADPTGHSGLALLIGTVAFWIQIYCDFSGYSTMARGLGMWFGFDIPRNFDYPLLKTNPADYRHAWHMTLGQWFTDYVYKPLGGSRVGDFRLVRNIMITWSLTGLWHGASWHFVLWGVYNGVILAVYVLWKRHVHWQLAWLPASLKPLLAWSVQLLLLLPSTALFRVSDMKAFAELAQRVLTWQAGSDVPIEWPLVIAALGLAHVWCYFHYEEDVLVRLRWPARIGLVTGATAAIALLAATGRPFIYFQF